MKLSSILSITLLIGVLVACNTAEKTKHAEQTTTTEITNVAPVIVSPAEFKAKMALPNVQIVDVRTDAEVAEGMLPGAVQMNINDRDNFIAKTANLDPNRPVLIYCRSGNRSGKAADYLAENGFKEIYDLEGGYMNWVAQKGETVIPK